MKSFNLKDQLAGIAALIAAIVAIGGGFVKYGEVMTKLEVLEGASKSIDMSFLSEIKVLEEKEEAQEEEPTSETATASSVQSKKLTKQKKIQQKKAIVKNLDRIMDKVDKDIKDIAKNLAIKNIIKMQAMTSEQASLAMYQNAIFYRPKDIYLDQVNIFDFIQIYPNTSLASYIQNDKIEIKARKLQEINSRKQKLLLELEMFKNV